MDKQTVTLGKAVYLGCQVCGQPTYFIFIFEFDDEVGRTECQANMDLLLSGTANVPCPRCGAPLMPCAETQFQQLNGQEGN